MTPRVSFALSAVFAFVAFACAGEQPVRAPRSSTAPGAPLPRATVADKDVLGWVVIANLDESLKRLAGHLGAGDGGPEGIKQAIAVRFTGAPDLAHAIDTSRALAAVVLEPSTQGDAPPYLLRVPITSRELFLEALGAAFGKVSEPGAERHVFEVGGHTRLYAAFEGAPDRESALLAFRPGMASQAVPLFARIAGKPTSDLIVSVNLGAMQARHEQELTSALVKLLVMSSPGTMIDPRSAHATRLVRRALSYVAAASSLEARVDLTADGVGIALRLESKGAQADNRLAAHVAEQEPAPVWGARLMPEDAMMVYATHTTRASRQEDAHDLVKYVSGSDATTAKADDEAEAAGLALSAFGDVLQGDLIYAVWPGKQGGIGVGGALRVHDDAQARQRAMDAYSALVPKLGETVAMELGLDPARFHFTARVRRAAAKAGGQAVDLVELVPTWPARSGEERRLFQWLFGDRLVLGMAFVGEHALYAAGRDWEPRLAQMVKNARGGQGLSIAQVPSFARAVELHQGGRVSMAYVSTPGLASFVVAVVKSTSKLGPEQRAMLDPFLRPGTDADAFVATTNVGRDGERAVYELHSHVPAAAVAELGRLGGAMWRVGLGPIFGPPAMPPLPTPPPNVTPPPPSASPPAPGAPTTL